MKCPKCGTEHGGGMCPKCGYIYIKENDDAYSNDIELNNVTFQSRPLGAKIIIGVGIGLAVMGFICFIIMAVTIFFPALSSTTGAKDEDEEYEETVDSSLMTLYEFERLRVGMSKSEVYDIVGSYGELMSESGSLSTDDYIQMYSYEGYGDLGANAILTFYNLELESKSQYGLKGGYAESTEHLERKEISNPEVDISQLSIDYNIRKDEIFDYCIEASYTNNTKYTITYLHIDIALDNGEQVLLIGVDDVAPGQISPKFNRSIEKAVPKSAVKFLKCTFEITDETGAELYVEYNYETKEYKFF